MFPVGAQSAFSTGRIFFFFFKMSEPPEIRVSSIEMHQPGSSLPRSLSCHVQKTADTTEGGLRDCTPLPLCPIINTDAGSAGGVEGGHGPQTPMPSPQRAWGARPGQPVRTLSRGTAGARWRWTPPRGFLTSFCYPLRDAGSTWLPSRPNVRKCQLVSLIRREQLESNALF